MTVDDLIVAHLPRLRGFALKMTRNRDDAADLVNDTIVRMLRARHRFELGTNFSAWAYTIMSREHADKFRRHHIRADVDIADVEDALVERPSQEGTVMLKETLRFMGTLSPEHQRAITLLGLDELNYEDAAAVCGVPVGTIKSRSARARRQLLECIEGR